MNVAERVLMRGQDLTWLRNVKNYLADNPDATAIDIYFLFGAMPSQRVRLLDENEHRLVTGEVGIDEAMAEVDHIFGKNAR